MVVVGVQVGVCSLVGTWLARSKTYFTRSATETGLIDYVACVVCVVLEACVAGQGFVGVTMLGLYIWKFSLDGIRLARSKICLIRSVAEVDDVLC